MQLELWTDFCSCFLFVHWTLSDSVWQLFPLVTLPKASRIHVQVLCQVALFQPLIWANWDANTYHISSNLEWDSCCVTHRRTATYTHTHFSFPLIHCTSAPFSSFSTLGSLCCQSALSLKAFPFPHSSSRLANSHSFLSLYMSSFITCCLSPSCSLRLLQSRERDCCFLHLVLFTCLDTAVFCLETLPSFEILKQWRLQPFPWDSNILTKLSG